jgi:hypothetical protein
MEEYEKKIKFLENKVKELENALQKFNIVKCEFCEQYVEVADRDAHECIDACCYCGSKTEVISCERCDQFWCEKCNVKMHPCKHF